MTSQEVVATNNTMPSSIKNSRKASKPLMEKRRRARINQSLSELKDLIVCSNKPEVENCRRKIEKADILEMTVQHLHRLHQNQTKEPKDSDSLPEDSCDSADGPNDNLEKFQAGFHECVMEVTRYLTYESAPFDGLARSRLTDHLNSCAERLRVDRSPTHHGRHSENPSPTPASPTPQPQHIPRDSFHQCCPVGGATSPLTIRPDSTTNGSSDGAEMSLVVALETPRAQSSSVFYPHEPEVSVEVPLARNRPSHPYNLSSSSTDRRAVMPLPASSYSSCRGMPFANVDNRAPGGRRLKTHSAMQAVKRSFKSILRLPQLNPAIENPVWRPW